MPLVFAVVSFFSYRFFRTYTYYELVIIAYEALVLMAFLALMLAYVGSSTNEQMQIMKLKEKRGLPWPLGCIRFRPSKPYFLHALNASVLQYAFLRPTISIIGMVCETYHVLCAHMMAPWFAKIYLDAVDFVSISIAFYGLVVLYVLVQDRLSGRRPVAKFLSIKLLVRALCVASFWRRLTSQPLRSFSLTTKPSSSIYWPTRALFRRLSTGRRPIFQKV